MKRITTGCLIAACLGLVACGSSTSSTGSNAGNTTGGGNGNATGASTAGGNVKYNVGDPVDINGDGKADGVAVSSQNNGVADGVDTNGDGKADAPLPGGSSGGTNGDSTSGARDGGGGTSAGGTSAGGTSAGTGDAGDALSCNGVGVCNDHYADTCDGNPDTCPTTQATGLDVPTWDCTGTPPANVYAYATFPAGTTVAGANLASGACVVFFEGAKGLFYAKWFKFGPATAASSCTAYEGCICPKGTGLNQSFDRRLYAFTWDGDTKCPVIDLVDHGNVNMGQSNLDQPVSNKCRKYLYALHGDGSPLVYAPTDGQPAFDLPFSYVAGSLAALKLRLKDFPKIEVACASVMNVSLPWAELMVSDVQVNKSYVAKP